MDHHLKFILIMSPDPPNLRSHVGRLSLDHFDKIIFEKQLVSFLAQMSDVALDVVRLDLMSTDAVGLDSGRRAAFSAAF